jgi:hypothetical protein
MAALTAASALATDGATAWVVFNREPLGNLPIAETRHCSSIVWY